MTGELGKKKGGGFSGSQEMTDNAGRLSQEKKAKK